MEKFYAMNFTSKEEAEVRRALVDYVKRVSSGQCTSTEAATLPFMVNVMFPDMKANLKHSANTPTN